jgi:GNAT superfamily N-acetyltransferase
LGGAGGGVSYGLRRAEVADAEAMVAVTAEGFATYRSFAPPEWSPPSAAGELERLLRLLADDDVWYLVGDHDGEVVGHVGFLPADRALHAVGDPALAHFRQLFVRTAHWGTGLAASLHGAAIAEATGRGFAAMRLFTPAAQARARRFYERGGWVLARPPAFEQLIGLEMAEYRRAL